MAVATSSSSSSSVIRARVGFFDDLLSYPLTFGFESAVRSANGRRLMAHQVREQLLSGELEVGLVSATDAALLLNFGVIPTAGVSVLGPSNLFLLVSKVLPGEIQRVLVDTVDHGAIPLAQSLIYHRIHIRPEFYQSEVPLHPASFDFRSDPHDAYLLTGVHGLLVRRDAFAWALDLTQGWYEQTNLPFVLYCWVCKKNIHVGTLDKDLAELAKRNFGETANIAKREAERLQLPQASLEQFISRILRTGFGTQEITSLRRYAKELTIAGAVQGNPTISVYQPPVVRR